MLEVISKFPCDKSSSLDPWTSREQLVVGRITSLTKSLSSPYSCQDCAMYRVDCYVFNNSLQPTAGGIEKSFNKASCWQRVYSEVRAVTFELRDPDDASCKAVHIPGKLLTVKYFHADMYEDISEENSIQLTECTPSVSALLGRCGLKGRDLKHVRLREWCVEENTQVGVFGVVAPSNTCDDRQMTIKPVCTQSKHFDF